MSLAFEPGGAALGSVTLAGAFDPLTTLQPVLLDAAQLFELTLIFEAAPHITLVEIWDDTPRPLLSPDPRDDKPITERVVRLGPGARPSVAPADASNRAVSPRFDERFGVIPNVFTTVVTSDVVRVGAAA